MYGLTRRETDLLNFLRTCEDTCMVPPSYDEMAAGIGLASKSGIHRMLESMEKRGAIKRLPFTARTVKVIPADMTNEGLIQMLMEDQQPMQQEVIDLIAEARRHAKAELTAGDNECTLHVLAVWLWHAMRGTSPGFLPKDSSQPPQAPSSPRGAS